MEDLTEVNEHVKLQISVDLHSSLVVAVSEATRNF